MARSATQFQKGLSLPAFQRLYGSEEQCEAALRRRSGPMGSAVPAAMAMSMGWSMAAGSSAISVATAAIRLT